MFKTAATKIAHNSTLPALGGNNDLRPLQDLITAEKAVLISLQKLSSDFSKASEALRTWGLGEGDDLGDILSASTTVLTHFSSALSQYASHGHAIRDQLKAIRTREEGLDDLKKRRRATLAKADSAEKKLVKMNPEHKNLAMQTDTLNRLRDEIRTMDSDIMTEEAALGDFKRSTTRSWMGLKFGGLLECCEKGTIAGEFGKLLIAEIPDEITQPGLPRSMYYGHTKTDGLVAEAHRCVSEVTLSTVAPSRRFNQQLPIVPQDFQQGQEYQANYQIQPSSSAAWNDDGQSLTNNSGFLPRASHFSEPADGPSSPTSLHSPYATLSNQNYIPPYGLPEIQDSRPDHTVDDFGVNTRTPGGLDSSSIGGRFATFPVNNRDGPSGGYTLHNEPPSLSGRLDDGQTLSMSIAEALSADPPNNGLMQNPHDPMSSIRSIDAPAPAYESVPPPLLHSRLHPSDAGSLQVHQGHSIDGSSASGFRHQRQESQGSADGSDALLAYMTTPSEGIQTPSHSDHFDDEELGKHVRFGQVSDVGNEIENRDAQPNVQSGSSQPQPQVTPLSQTEATNKPPSDQNSTKSETSGIIRPSIHRIPPPSVDAEEDERALNAAAAREITREMDALHFSPPVTLDTSQSVEPTPEHGQSNYNDYNQRNPSPLPHPTAPFTQRSVSPHPYAELNSNSYNNSSTYNAGQSYQAAPTYNHSQNGSPAQVYAQSFQPPSSYNQSQVSSTPPEVHLNTNLPPRFQALAQSPNLSSPDMAKNHLPPRFQAALANPPPHDGQPTPIGPLPPRFQASLAQSSPSTSDQQDRFMPVSNASTPYRTPPEYPRNLGASPFTKSNTSLSSPVGLTGTRTISAAAFKRPPPHKGSGDGIALSSPVLKKRLPSSPYPQRGADMPRDVVSQPGGEIDEEFDYIGAYVNTENPSTGTFDAPNQSRGPDSGAKPGGYAEGRFATDLESNLR